MVSTNGESQKNYSLMKTVLATAEILLHGRKPSGGYLNKLELMSKYKFKFNWKNNVGAIF